MSVLSEPVIREANVTLAREKRPVRLVLIADILYVLSDPDTYKCLNISFHLALVQGCIEHRAY